LPFKFLGFRRFLVVIFKKSFLGQLANGGFLAIMSSPLAAVSPESAVVPTFALFPTVFRGETPLAASRTSINSFAALAIVALRFVIGAHFFHEGYTKWRDPKPYSGAFFNAAKGPFAPFFQSHVLDRYGLERLDIEKTEKSWNGFISRATQELKLDKDKSEQAKKIMAVKMKELKLAIDRWDGEIEEYMYGLERQRENSKDGSRAYDSFKAHDAKIASELMPKRMVWQAGVDKIWKELERDVNKLAEGDKSPTYVNIDKPGRFEYDSEFLDQTVPYFHMTVGVLLVIGLLTRVSALAAAAFVGSVVLSQWPFTPGTISTSYQQVEFFALLVLAAIGAGQWAGFDALLYGYCCLSDKPPPQPQR
jgi:uncharacterized membrane protein YphA (DoxX/SURF4 family)